MAVIKTGHDRFGRKVVSRTSRTSPGFGRRTSDDSSNGFSAFTGDAFGSSFTDNSPSQSSNDFGGGGFDGGGSSSD
jgi:hypothetical protein